MGKPWRPSKFNTPEELWNTFVKYWEFNEKQTWAKDDFIKSGPGAGQIVSMTIPNPPSLMGFCLFANISLDTFRNYDKKTCENSSDFLAVTQAIRASILENQISGAATNTFNSNIIARVAGLVDKQEIKVDEKLSEDERKDLIKEILEQAGKK
jgi:hypothetical protein